MAAFPREGFRDIARHVRRFWLRVQLFLLRRELFQAEAALGWLGWEQVDFFDNEINEQVRKVQEFENAQASLLNVSAELSGSKAALDEELAREKAIHDEAQAALALERAPIAAQYEEVEARRRLKVEAVARFERAIEEMARMEKELEARSLAYMNVQRLTPEIRAAARQVSDALGRLPAERHLVLADKANAMQEAARLEPVLAPLRAELQRIDTAAAAASDRLADATRRLTSGMRRFDREQKKSDIRMAHLDREKQTPYRLIGACLADHGISPLNQPQVLDKVLDLRAREAKLTQTLFDLQAACAAASPGLLTAFYFLLAALLLAVCVLAYRFAHY